MTRASVYREGIRLLRERMTGLEIQRERMTSLQRERMTRASAYREGIRFQRGHPLTERADDGS
jgi:hypothetical protein